MLVISFHRKLQIVLTEGTTNSLADPQSSFMDAFGDPYDWIGYLRIIIFPKINDILVGGIPTMWGPQDS